MDWGGFSSVEHTQHRKKDRELTIMISSYYVMGRKSGNVYKKRKQDRMRRQEELAERFRVSYKISSKHFENCNVRKRIAENRKIGPFVATSGLVLPYYLNVSTNFLDREIAGKINEVMFRMLKMTVVPALIKTFPDAIKRGTILVGPEMAGGVMVSQLCVHPHISELGVDLVYMRKQRKTSGTCQQLEGPKHITSRNQSSPLAYAIWIDDCMSSGSSSVEGKKTLKRDYNIDVKACVYLIDRHIDRASMSADRLANIFTALRGVEIYAMFDMDDITKEIALA